MDEPTKQQNMMLAFLAPRKRTSSSFQPQAITNQHSLGWNHGGIGKRIRWSDMISVASGVEDESEDRI